MDEIETLKQEASTKLNALQTVSEGGPQALVRDIADICDRLAELTGEVWTLDRVSFRIVHGPQA